MNDPYAAIHGRTSTALLNDVQALLMRYVVFTRPEQSAALALWVLHTYVSDAFDFTPYLHVSSPERQCGKTRLLEVLKLLVAAPWGPIITPSEAVTFRKIERDHPTMLLDEMDAVFGGKGANEHEHLRALIDAGNARGAFVPRCVGPRMELRDFETFCPKVLAGIGHLPDTIADRSVPIELKRKRRGEQVAKFRRRTAAPEFEMVRERLETWAVPALEELRDTEPSLPDDISDRAADAWEPLLAIADLAGGEWPILARTAAVALATGPSGDSEQSMRLRLLSDVRTSVRAMGDPERVPTTALLDALYKLEEAPWGDYNGKPFSAERLARVLHGYDCRSTTARIADGSLRKAYMLADLEDAFSRYLPLETASTRNTSNNPHGYVDSGPSQPVTDRVGVTGCEVPADRMVDPMLRVLRDETAQKETEGYEGDSSAGVEGALRRRLIAALVKLTATAALTHEEAGEEVAQAEYLGIPDLKRRVARLEGGVT